MNANQKKCHQWVSFCRLVQMTVAVVLGGLGFDTLWPLVSKGAHYLLIILFVIFMLTFIVVALHEMGKVLNVW